MSENVTLPKFRAKKYHRRSFWACDECKLRKKKCDGSQPCATCQLHGKGSKDCTYDSKTRPSQPPTHRIRELEDDVRAVRALLSRVRDNLAGDTLADVDTMIMKLRPAAEEPSQLSSPTATDKSNAEGLQSMLPPRDRVLRDASRSLCYGPYSGPAMILSVLEFFQPTQGEAIVSEVLNMFDAEFSISPFPRHASAENGTELMIESEAFELLSVVLMQSHPFLRSLDPSFLHSSFERVYHSAAEECVQVDEAYLSLYHMVLAIGNLLSVGHHRRSGCATAISKAQSHFGAGCKLIDLSDCHNTTHLQIFLLASTFLVFVSRLSSAYTFVNLAISSATQMGFLSEEKVPFLPLHYDSRVRDRIIATLINIDLYLSTVLGLDSAVPSVTASKRMEDATSGFAKGSSGPFGLLDHIQDPSQSFDVLKKNFDITQLTASTLRNFHDPISSRQQDSSQNVVIDETILRMAARELANLSKDPSSPLSPSVAKVRYPAATSSVAKSEFEFSLYWSQLSIHIPFLHYLRPLADGHPIPDSASRPALTCLKIAVNVIVRCEFLLHSLTDSDAYSQFMHPGNWTCIYTLFLAVIALIFLISIHEGTSKPSEAWRKADSGIRILTALRCGDRGAAPCLAVIKKLVSELNYTVDFDFENIEKTTRRVCERQTKLPTLSNILGHPLSQTTWSSPGDNSKVPYQFTKSERESLTMSSADKMLVLAQNLLLKTESSSGEHRDMA